jgi:GT2 family glycosyltransferase
LREELQRVTVVIVTYNSAHCVDGLLPLLLECPHVIVSDNGSEDGTIAAFRAKAPHVQCLEHGQNLGFGAANNKALSQVKTQFSLLINPDCHFEADQLGHLIKQALLYPEAAILAPQILKSNGKPDVNYRWPSLYWSPSGPQADGPICVGFVCGAVMLFCMKNFQDAVFFDEDFFLYYEDDDLCLRLFQQHRPMVVIPHIVATHFNRGSVKGRSPWRSEYWRGYHHAQSKLIFAGKHQSTSAAVRLRRQLMVLTLLALPLRLLAFSPRLIARMVGRWRGLMFYKT